MERIDQIESIFDKREAPTTPVVSPAVIKRLPRYHRYLGELLRMGRLRISSAELSRMMNVTASQIRQDLNCFGGFGQQGYGYNVDALYEEIGNILGLKQGLKAVLIGAGNLGIACQFCLGRQIKGQVHAAGHRPLKGQLGKAL